MMKIKVICALVVVTVIAATAIYFIVLTPSKNVFEGTLIQQTTEITPKI